MVGALAFAFHAPGEHNPHQEELAINQIPLQCIALGEQRALPDEEPAPVTNRYQRQLAQQGGATEAHRALVDHARCSFRRECAARTTPKTTLSFLLYWLQVNTSDSGSFQALKSCLRAGRHFV